LKGIELFFTHFDEVPPYSFSNHILGSIAKHYISLAINKTSGNKATAAKLLGFKSSQVLTNWIKKYEM
jgi:DNA-binding protein Fis